MTGVLASAGGIIASSAVTVPPMSWHDFPSKYSWLADDLPDGNVASWVDGQNGVTLAQATSGAQPIRSATTGANGQPAVTFDGVNDFLQTASVTASQPDTIIVIGTHSGGAYLFTGTNNQALTIKNGRWIANAGVDLTGPVMDGFEHTFRCFYNGGSSALAIDGDATLGNGGTNDLTGFVLGGWRNGGFNGDAVISAICIVSGDITTYPEWPALQSLILSKWGLTA